MFFPQSVIASRLVGRRWYLKSHCRNIKYQAPGLLWSSLRLTTDWRVLRSYIKPSLFKPILAPMLRKRLTLRILTIAAALQLGLTATGLPGWQCQFNNSIGIPCPGCGLSTAVAALIRGEWQSAAHTHIFAPVFLIGLIFMGILSVLPVCIYRNILHLMALVEQNTGFATFISIALVGYWGIRIHGLL